MIGPSKDNIRKEKEPEMAPSTSGYDEMINDTSVEDLLDLIDQQEEGPDMQDILGKSEDSAKGFNENRLNEMIDKGVDLDEAYQGQVDVAKELYEKQGWDEMLGRALGGGLYKGALTAVENLGYVADLAQVMTLTDDLDKGYSNMVSEKMSEMKGEYDEANPIYSQGFMDWGWAAQMLQSTTDSAVGFAVPGGLIGKGIGASANALGKLMGANALFVDAFGTAATALATNYAESMFMGQELYKDIYNEAIAKGISEEEASSMASRKAEEFRWANKINFVTDAIALRGVVSGKALVSGAAKKSLKQKALGFGLDSAAESIEEGVGGFQQGDYTREGLEELGLKRKSNKNLLERSVDYISSDAGATEMLSGLASGPFQAGGAKLVKKGVQGASEKAGWSNKPNKDPGEYTGVAPKTTDEKYKVNGVNVLDGKRPMKPDGGIDPGSLEDYVKAGLPKGHTDQHVEDAMKGGSLKTAYSKKEIEYKDKQAKLKDFMKKHEDTLKAFDEFEADNSEHKALKDKHDKIRERLKKESEEYEESKNAGTVEQTKKEVSKFLANDAKLVEEYQTATLDGDMTAMQDIEDQRFENLFLKHAQQGTAREDAGSLEEQLKAAAADPNQPAESRELAKRMVDRIPQMQEDYKTIYGKYKLTKNNVSVWKAKTRMDSTGELLGKLDVDVNNSLVALADEVRKVKGGDVSPYDMEHVKMRAEMAALKIAENKVKSREVTFTDPVLELELEKRKIALQNKIDTYNKHEAEKKQLEKDLKTGETPVYKTPTKEVEAFSSMEKVRSLMESQAMGKLAYDKYKQYYEYSKGNMSKDMSKLNHSFIAEQLKSEDELTLAEARSHLDNKENIILTKTQRKDLEKRYEVAMSQAANREAERKQTIIDVKERRQLAEDNVKIAQKAASKSKLALDKAKRNLKSLTNTKLEMDADQDLRSAAQGQVDMSEGLNEFNIDILEDPDSMFERYSNKAPKSTTRENEKEYQKVLDSIKRSEEEVNEKLRSFKEADISLQDYEMYLRNTPTVGSLPGMETKIEFDAESFKQKMQHEIDPHLSPDELRAAAALETDPNIKKQLINAAYLAENTKEPGKGGVIETDDYVNPSRKAPIDPTWSKGEKKKHSLPQNIQFVSHTDEWEGKKTIKDNSALANYLETTPETNKVGMKVEFEIDPSFDEKANADTVPIKIFILNKKGERVEHNNEQVFGYLAVNTDKYKGKQKTYAQAQRTQVIYNAKKGKKTYSVITNVGNGTLMYKAGDVNDLRSMTGKTGGDILLATSDGAKLQIGNGNYLRSKAGDDISKNLTKGFTYAVVRGLNGKPFYLKMNSRKLRKEEVDILYSLVSDLFNGKKMGDKVDYKHLNGISYKKAIDLLVYEGSESMSTKYPFRINFKDKTLTAGSHTYTVTEMIKNSDAIKDFFGTMWRTTNSNMINNSMREVVSNRFTWPDGEGGSREVTTKESYNDFVMNDNALSTNTRAVDKRLFIQPFVEIKNIAGKRYDPESVDKTKAKRVAKQTAVKKIVKKAVSTTPSASSTKGDAPAINKSSGDTVLSNRSNAEVEKTQGPVMTNDELEAAYEQVKKELRERTVEATKGGPAKSKKKGEAKKEPVTEQPSSSVEEQIAELEEERSEELRKSIEKNKARGGSEKSISADKKTIDNIYDNKIKSVKHKFDLMKGAPFIDEISHTSTGEISIYAKSPKGKKIRITYDNGNYDLYLDYQGIKDGEPVYYQGPIMRDEDVEEIFEHYIPKELRDILRRMDESKSISELKSYADKDKSRKELLQDSIKEAEEQLHDYTMQLRSLEKNKSKDREIERTERLKGHIKEYDAKIAELKAKQQQQPSSSVEEVEGVTPNEVIEIVTKSKSSIKTKATKREDPNAIKVKNVLFSQITEDKVDDETVNIEKESSDLFKMMPNIPVMVHLGLIGAPGGPAEGMFYDGLITLSNKGKRGVGYHEGFHAISQMYLSPEDRATMYEEARKVYGALDGKGKPKTDRQLEEDLAEGFREYMRENGVSRMSKMPKVIKWLYESLMDLLEAFTNKKKRHIFEKIRQGRFHYKPTNARAQDILYSMALPGLFVRSVVDGITYNVITKSGIRYQANDSSTMSGIFNEIRAEFKDIRNQAEDAGREDIVTQYDLLDAHWPKMVELAQIDLSTMDIVEGKDQKDIIEFDDFEEKISGELNIKNAFEYSGKDNANSNTKLMVKTLREVEFLDGDIVPVSTEDFGRSMPKLASFNTSWRLLESHITGIVGNDKANAQELMLGKLKSLITLHPPFQELVDMLEDPNVPRYKKTQFYKTFHRQNSFFSGANGRIVKNLRDAKQRFATIWTIGNADSKRKAVLIRNSWEESFIMSHTDGGKKIHNKNSSLSKAKAQFELLDKQVLDKDKEYKTLSKLESTAKNMSHIFGLISMDVSAETISTFFDQQRGSTIERKIQAGMDELQFIFKEKRNTKVTTEASISTYLSGKAKWDERQNIFRNQRVILKLAKIKGEESRVPGEGGILLPDGTMVFPVSQNHHMSKSLAKWKATGGKALEQLLNTSYHKGSFVGAEILKEIQDTGETNFNLEVFAYNKLDDGRDPGNRSGDISEIDEMIDRLNRTLAGSKTKNGIGSTFTPLTYADKSMVTMLSGIKMRRFDMQGDNVSDLAMDVFYGYAEAEMARISQTLKKNKNKGFDNIKFYSNKGGLKSFWFPELSYGTEFAKKNKLYDEKTLELNINSETREAIETYIATALLESTQAEIAKAEKLGIIKDGSLIGVDDETQGVYGLNGDDNIALTELFSDYTLNSMMANIEFTMLFSGDPAFYSDLSKRTPFNVSTGEDLMSLSDDHEHDGIPDTFNVAVSKDLEKGSSLISDYEEILGLEKSAVYRKNKENKEDGMNVADAQAFITPERFRNLMIGLGSWNDELHQPVFEALINKEGKAKKKDLLVMQDLIRQVGVPSGQPMKGVFFELRHDSNNPDIAIPTALKYSQAILWPGFIQGTELEQVYESMITPNKDGKVIDELVFESGVKVGATNTSTFGPDMEMNAITLNNYGWKLQQDLPAKYDKKEKALVGSQPKKNILANIANRQIQWKGESIKGDEFAKLVHNVERLLSDEGVKALSNTMGVTEDGYIKDPSKIYEDLTKSLQHDKASNNIIDQTKDEAPFDSIFQFIEKLDSMLHTSVTSKTVKLTSPGGSFIQTSNVGMKSIKPEPMNKEQIKDLNGVIYLEDVEELRGARRNADGNTISADVLLPFKSIQRLLDANEDLKESYEAGTLTGEVIKKHLGDTTENLVGYRIPNQGMSSIDSLHIVGILPSNMGDSIVTYSEVTAKTGSDFDIDKMYVMMYNTEYNPVTKKMERVDSNVEKLDALQAELEAKIETTITKRLVDKYKDDLRDLKKTRVKALENLRTELWSAILKSPDTYKDLITPLDSEFLKNDAYYLAFLEEVSKASSAEKKKIFKQVGVSGINAFLKASNKVKMANDYFKNKPLKALEFARPSHQQEIKKRNMAGKAGVGQTANHLTHHPLSQLAKLNMAYIGIGNQTKDGKTDLSGTYINEKNGKGSEQITEVISAWLNAYVDNAKDPYISLINNNTETANTVFMLLRAGVDPEWVNRFMSQPMIKEYVENVFNSKSKNVRPDAREKKFLKEDEKGVVKEEKTRKYVTFEVDDKFELKSVIKQGPLDAMGRLLEDFDLNPFDVNGLPVDTGMDLNKLSKDQLEKGILKGENTEHQFKLLKEFLVLQKRAEKLNDAVNASKSDTKGAFGNSAENLQAREMFRQAQEEGHVGNFEALFNETMLGGFYENGTILSHNITSKLILSKTAAIEDTILSIMKRQGLGEYMTNKKINGLVMSAARSYMYGQTELFNKGKNERLNLFVSKTGSPNVASQFRSMKKADPNNLFLENFYTKKDQETGYEFIVTDGLKGKDQTEVDMLWQEWENMLNSTDDATKKFAEDMVQMAYYSSGFKKGANSFYDLIPSTYMKKSFNSSISKFVSDAQNGGVMESFVDQFIRHNYNDTKIVPAVRVYGDEQGNMNTGALKTKHGITSAVKGNFRSGIVIKEGDLFPEQFKRSQEGNTIHPVEYINIANDKGTPYLYRYVGVKSGEHFFEGIEPLGMDLKGNRVVEYGNGSSLKWNNLKLIPQSFYKKFKRVGEPSNNELGELKQMGRAYQYAGSEVSFMIEERMIQGTLVNVALLITNGRGVVVAAALEKDEAKTLADSAIRKMGKSKLERIIKQPC